MTKKWVCPVCGYVYEGEILQRNVLNAKFRAQNSS